MADNIFRDNNVAADSNLITYNTEGLRQELTKLKNRLTNLETTVKELTAKVELL